MTTSARYKVVKNTTNPAVVLNPALINASDGNDKLFRIVTRVYAAADCGAAANQTRGAGGCIIDALPIGTNVQAIIGLSYKAGILLDNLLNGVNTATLAYSYNSGDGTIRVADTGGNAATQLAANDITYCLVVLGTNS